MSSTLFETGVSFTDSLRELEEFSLSVVWAPQIEDVWAAILGGHESFSRTVVFTVLKDDISHYDMHVVVTGIEQDLIGVSHRNPNLYITGVCVGADEERITDQRLFIPVKIFFPRKTIAGQFKSR